LRHQDLTINHRLESWVYANTAARIATGTYAAGDIGRIAYQSDTAQYWRLTAVTGTSPTATPTWANVEAMTTATFQTVEFGLAGTTSTTGVMYGLGANGAVITPVRSGKVFVTFGGLITNNVAGSISAVLINYGTGTPPANGAAITGTRLGQSAQAHNYAAGAYIPFSLSGIVVGLTLGTQAWFDIVQVVVAGGGTVTLFSTSGRGFELP
jgi:hypothetical protein